MGQGWPQETTQAWPKGMIGVRPCPCSLLSPPSFLFSIKVCCFLKATRAVWLTLLLLAT